MSETVALLRHFLAAIAYRTQKALLDAPENFGEFHTGHHVRTPTERVRHVTSVLGYECLGKDQPLPKNPDRLWPEAPSDWIPPREN